MSKSYSLKDKVIYLKVESAYAVWFKASRNFLMMEEPAFYILKLFLKNVLPENIINQFSNRYKISIAESQKFVLEVEQNLQQYCNPQKIELVFVNDSKINQLKSNNFYKEKIYSICNLIIKMKYGDRELEEVIHPLISHHETEENSFPKHVFEIFRHTKKLFLKVNSELVDVFNFNETGYLKASVLLKLLSILYSVANENWMMAVHASAITNGSSAIVFPAMAGSGKSTLATLMHAHGFNLLSDDFLAMDIINKSVYYLPVAATIKEGSLDVLSPHFPELMDISPEKAYTGKQVRYLPTNNSKDLNIGFKASSFVFINYSRENTFKFEEINKKEAIQTLLHETWVNPKPAIITEFFNWFDKTKFYKLSYCKTSDALKVVNKLFIQ